MKPGFQEVFSSYPRSEAREQLYQSLGWGDIANHDGYKDTCAIRMSYALALSRVLLPGAPMRVKAGPAVGRFIEHRQGKLSAILKRIWGKPEVYSSESAARAGIGSRPGVVSFFKIEGTDGGHIDLVAPNEHGILDCARSCYFTAKTIWFWPLG